VIEDACQAHGAEYRGRKAGSIGDAGCFSFYPGKNLGAFGEAGAVVTNNRAIAQQLYILRDHGQEKKYHHVRIGWNGRMDGIQAAVLRIKLRQLEAGNAARQALARTYNDALAACPGVIVPHAAPDQVHVYHLYVVRLREREAVMQALAQRGITTGIHYPRPVHLQEAYRSLGYTTGSFPVAEQCAQEVLSLPMFPQLAPAAAVSVAQDLAAVLDSLRPAWTTP
jgi:dTDP-4-amino-4,6-dideoxygalactose transaminase